MKTHDTSKRGGSGKQAIGDAERDIIALGIAIAAIIMFVGTGGAVVPDVIRSLSGVGLGPDQVLVNALLLNIALIIFGWRRYRQLTQEVQERRKAEEQARHLAEIDPLTGCLNRRSIGPAADGLIAEAKARGEIAAIIMIDLDNFKQINDFNGHSAGDQILQDCAQRIASVLPQRSVLARLGGDEFVTVVAVEKNRLASIDHLATTIVEAVCEPVTVNGVEVRVTASLGLTSSEAGSMPDGTRPADSQTLLHMADIAMYHAKKQGRNCFYWFEEPMEDELRFRTEIEAGIRKGIPRGEFVPYYEQQIDLQTGELTGFEMLARWHSPKLGVVSPEIFIPIAEEIGAIGELSEQVIARALDDAKAWDPRLSLAVNISPLQLRDPWFAQKLLRLLVEANFPPERLEIEITESCLHENVAIVRSLITSLKNQGIRVSLDDFGTGYSSLAQLRNLPFDRIKIDRSFVTNLVENKDSEAIVHAIAMLGKGLGLPITVEGIETADVLDKLRQYGDIKGQGYLYGLPLTANEARDTLSKRNLLGGGEIGRKIARTLDAEVSQPALAARIA
ncbi:putative bifunctional diguanylate cyclase/phosphodiesterase [Novosphingobium marinum]|uniref:Diguanylate cyclase (GGDEF)-like protein n=1 Tax=Novosphingobium marinum TaxID=1514948 RepID=A0A7Y9XYC9_9SPHN|nr:EAL domain-containing protein [Novosphingobium marinum]NYH96884.1 diguanylate cyclase (GGDEF)-like protein [Novosphingobium marinum]